MTLRASASPLEFLAGATIAYIVRHSYLSTSVMVHAVLLALLYYFGSYQPELRQQEAEIASSLRATNRAITAKRVEDMQIIKQLLAKSADHVDGERDPPETPPQTPPQTPQEMLKQARELSSAIEALEKEIEAEELDELTRALEPRTLEAATNDEAGEPLPDASEPIANEPPAVTDEIAEREVAALESKARATLFEREQRLMAKENGVPVKTQSAGAGEQTSSGKPSASRVTDEGPNPSVRAEISDFIASGGRAEEMRPSLNYSSLDFFNDGALQIPPVDAANMVRGRGRILGAGGEFANRVYLNSWYIIGPFPGRHGAGLFDNPAYPPEKAVLLDAVYLGKDQRLLKWRYVTSQRYPLVPPDPVEDSVYYGYTEVFVDEACDLIAWIGADDDVQVHLNGRMVWSGGNVNKRPYFHAVFNTRNTYLKDYNRTEGDRVLHFNKGRNRIFFKLSNGPNDPYLSFVLTRD